MCALWSNATNTSSPRGNFVPTTTQADCLTRCLAAAACVGVDVGPNFCSLHSNVDDFRTTITTVGVTQFRLNRRCITEMPSTSSSPSSTKTSTAATAAAAASATTATGIFCFIYNYFTNLMVASKYAKKYINKYNTTKKKETRIWHVPAKHANRMDARAHSSTLAECAPKKIVNRRLDLRGL